MIEPDPSPHSGLFGKVRSRGDFIRSGRQGPSELAFQEWLAAAVEHSGGVLPSTAVRFLIAPPGGDGTLVGVWLPSRDVVGRGFPLALFHRLPDDVAGVPWSVVPAHYAGYLEQSERCLARGADQPLEWLKGAVLRLELPHPSALPRVWSDARRSLAELELATFSARVFARVEARGSARERHGEARGSARAQTVDPLAYALCTLQRASALAEEELTLDLPIVGAADMFAWLELLRGVLGPEKRPCALLWAASAGRLLASLGTLSQQLIAFLTEPEHKSSRRWPVWTASSAAGASARAELSEGARAVLEHDATLSALVDALSCARASISAGGRP